MLANLVRCACDNSVPVLARSTSHHQLMARSLPYHLRSAYNSRQSAATLLDVDSGSDYESDILGTGGAYAAPYGRVASRRLVPGSSQRPTAPLFDPKAAEFNQYLLEQQEMDGEGQAGASGALSDDEDYLTGGVGMASSSGLTRSRSCMLGPGAVGGGGKQQKFSGSSGRDKKSAGDANKLGTSWDSTAAGRASMG